MQGFMVRGHHIRAIELVLKQMEAMKGHRVYQPVSQLDKLVPQAHIAGRDVPEPAEELAAPFVEQKCSMCKASKELPPAQKCQSCGGWACAECFPSGRSAACPVCSDPFAGSADALTALQPLVPG